MCEPVPHSISTFKKVAAGEIATSIMEQDEENLQNETVRLKYRMRIYNPSHLNSVNLDQHENKMKEREEVLENLNIATLRFITKFSSQLGQEKINEVKSQLSSLEAEFLVYRENFLSKATELKNASTLVSSMNPSMNNISSNFSKMQQR